MAYYRNVPGKKEKVNYAETGSWDEEGTHYRGKEEGPRDKPGPKRGGKRLSENRTAARRETFSGSRGKRDEKGTRTVKAQPESRRTERLTDRPAGTRNSRPEFVKKTEGGENAGYLNYEYRKPTSGNPVPEADERILCGRNPIREALRSGREIEKLLVQKGELSGSAREIVMEARNRKIMVQEVDRRRLDEIALHHQGLVAFASIYQYAEVEDILAVAKDRGEAPFIIILDGVTDPHNLGAVIRTAECVGAHGVILPTHRSVGLTPAAVKASAGAIEYIKVARVINLNRTIEDLKKRGIWTYAVTMDGKDYEKVDFRGPTALIIGAEGEGISRLTAEKCDMSVSLPLKGILDSLNASVAAGVIMYRVLSCRR